MLLNGGELNGVRYLKPETIQFFTAYHSDISRRGYGFDKPEKDNATRKEPYPSALASPETFGHTGFTGTCVWVDPKVGLSLVNSILYALFFVPLSTIVALGLAMLLHRVGRAAGFFRTAFYLPSITPAV